MVCHDGHLYVFTVNHPAGAWNENHVVSSSMSAQIELLPDQIIEYVGEQGYNKTYIQATDPALDADKHVTTGDYWIKKAHAKMTWGDVKGTSNVWNNYRTGQWADLYIGISEIYCRNASGQWIQVYNTDIVATAYTQIRQTQFEITQEAYRANAAEGELQSRIRQTADQISMEVSRATAAENSKIAKTGIYQTAEAIVTEAVRQSASDAQQSYIAKTGIYQDADSIVSEAYRQATTTAGETYIAKTNVYQTADSIMQEAVKTSAVNVAPAFLATKAYAVGDVVSYQGNVYRFKTAHPAGAWNASHVDQTNLNNASSLSYIAKTSQYQTADEIVSKAEAYTDGELTSYSTTTQTNNMISSYVTNNAYGLVSGITINASGIEISGSKYLKMKSGGYIEVNSGGKIDLKSGATFTVTSGNFSIDSNGNVSMTGSITSKSGSIGGWTISNSWLATGSGASHVALVGGSQGSTSATDWNLVKDYAFYAGANWPADAPFWIKKDGSFYASSGTFTGEVNATSGSFIGSITSKSGSIGSWNIAESWLKTGSNATCVTLVGGSQGDTSEEDWNKVKNYAMYAGASWPANAPFRLTKSGELTVTKLKVLDKNSQETEVNLRTAGLWKLNGASTIVSHRTDGGYCTSMTLSSGEVVNFKSAASVELSEVHEIKATSTFGVGTAYTLEFSGLLTNGKLITDTATFNATEAYDAGYSAGSPYGGVAIGARVAGTTYAATVTRKDGTTVLTVATCSAPYSDGVADGEAEFQQIAPNYNGALYDYRGLMVGNGPWYLSRAAVYGKV